MSPKSPENTFENLDNARGSKSNKQRVFGAVAGAAILAGGLTACADGEPAPTPPETSTSTETPDQEPTETNEPTHEPSPTDLPTDVEPTDPETGEGPVYYEWRELTREDVEIPSGLSAEDFADKWAENNSRAYSYLFRDDILYEWLEVDGSEEDRHNFLRAKAKEAWDSIFTAQFADGWRQDKEGLVKEYEEGIASAAHGARIWIGTSQDSIKYKKTTDILSAEVVEESESGRKIELELMVIDNIDETSFHAETHGGKTAVVQFSTVIEGGVEKIASRHIVSGLS